MKKAILFVLILIQSAAYLRAQNPDIDLLRRINSPEPAQQCFWPGASNSVYWVFPAYTVANLTYGLIGNDKLALSYSLECTLSAGISLAITGCIKNWINRPRPAQAYPGLIKSYNSKEGKSFPSGHTALAFSTATTASFQSNKWFISVPVFTWPIAVGYSRMRLGRHYPSDVLCGALIGIGSGLLSHWITNRMAR